MKIISEKDGLLRGVERPELLGDPPPVESRFALSLAQYETDDPGLVLTEAGEVVLVAPDGSRTSLGGGGGTDLPIADPTGYTVDTTTYPNEITGTGFYTTLVQPVGADDGSAILATAVLGDAYPRLLLLQNAGAGLLLGDGTVDLSESSFGLQLYGGGLSGGYILGSATGASQGLQIVGDATVDGNIGLQLTGNGAGNVGDIVLSPASELLLIQNLPTEDPDLADAIWADDGVLVLSGSVVPSGGLPTGWSVDTPNVGDFSYAADDRTILFGPNGDPTDPDSGLVMQMVCIADTTVELAGGPTNAHLRLELPTGAQINLDTTYGVFSEPNGDSSIAFQASGGEGATTALDAGGLIIINVNLLIAGSGQGISVLADASHPAVLSDQGADVGSGSGVFWNLNEGADGEQWFTVATGADGDASLQVDPCGETILTVHGPGSTPLTLAGFADQTANLLYANVGESTVFAVEADGSAVIQGVLVAPSGGSTGDVLTQQDDGSFAPASGGSQPLATVYIGDSDDNVYQSGAAPITGGESLAGQIAATLAYFGLAAPTGPVVNLADVSYQLAGTVESTDDAFDILISVLVSDAAGTNVASCQFQTQLPNPVTSLTANGTLTGTPWSIDEGSDLTADGDVLSSTAGVNYFVSISFSGYWD